MVASVLASLAGLALGASVALWVAGPPLAGPGVAALEVEARPVPLDRADPSRERVGRLRYLGGLELRSPDRRFGGISAILWEEPCARLLAVTDTGAWMILEPDETAAAGGEDAAPGRLSGIRAAWLAPILGTDGRPPASKSEADAEALARAGGETFVAFEQDHRLQRHSAVSACDPSSLATPAHRVDRPALMRGWPENGGAEAVARAGDRLLILSEEAAAGPGLRAGLLWHPETGAEQPRAHRPPAGHAATGMDEIPGGGGHLLLFRRFTPLEGVSAIVARVRPAADGRGDAPLEVEELARLAPPLAVDNLEGIAVRRAGDRVIVYLASDNNFNPLQRTLLLKFELLP